MAFVLLVWQNRVPLTSPVVPHGDLAADMLLQQRLARGEPLLVGHYSRFGFNHPGPALLLIRAAGASLTRGVLPTPYNGQLGAVLLMNAAFLGLAALALWRSFGGERAGVAAAAIGVAVAWWHFAWWPPPLSEVWAPGQMVAPFFAFMLLIVSACLGDTVALVLAAVTGGVLFQAHAAMAIFVIPLWALGVVSALRVHRWRLDHLRSPLRWSAVVILLTMAPAIVDSLANWPGNLGRMVRAAAATPREWSEDRWTGSLWNAWSSVPAGVWVLSAVAVAWVAARRELEPRVTTLMMIAMVATGLSALYAATIPGVTYEYLWYFYAGVPLIFVLAAPLQAVSSLSGGVATVLATGIVALCTLSVSHRSTYHSVPALATFAEAIATQPRVGRVVLAFEPHERWPNAVGLLLELSRRGVDACAVGQYLSFLITPEYTCSTDAAPSFRLGTAERCGTECVARDGGLGVTKVQPLAPGSVWTLAGDNPEAFGDGWSDAEPAGTWTAGSEASFFVTGSPSQDVELSVTGEAFVGDSHPVQRVEVVIGDQIITRWTYTVADPGGRRAVRIPSEAFQHGENVRIVLRTPDAVSPRRVGLGLDPRTLALRVTEVRLTPVRASALEASPDTPLFSDYARSGSRTSGTDSLECL